MRFSDRESFSMSSHVKIILSCDLVSPFPSSVLTAFERAVSSTGNGWTVNSSDLGKEEPVARTAFLFGSVAVLLRKPYTSTTGVLNP